MKNKNSVKERIMQSANLLFANRGFKGTSMRDISSHADVSLSMINYHFLSKSNLLLEMLNQFSDSLIFALKEITNSNMNDWEKLEGAIETIYATSEKKINTIIILLQETNLKKDEEVEVIFHGFSNSLKNLLDSIFRKGVQNKTFNSYYDPQFLTTLFIGTISNSIEGLHGKKCQPTNSLTIKEITYQKNHIKTELIKLFQHILKTPIPSYN